MIEAFNKQFGTSAKVTGRDKADFGDERGPIDVLTNSGTGDPSKMAFWYGADMGQGGGDGENTGGGGGGSGGGGGNLFGSVDQYMSGQAGGSSEGGAGGGQSITELMSTLKGLFPGGAFNQDIVNRRTEGARENLERFGRSRSASNRAQLAERGLLGSGPEVTAQNRVEQDIADRYSGATRDIYADESEAADRRMTSALSMAAGLSESDANRLVDWFRASTERGLGEGGLALGHTRASNEYNLGLGQFGIDRDKLAWMVKSGRIDQLIKILELQARGADTSALGKAANP